MASSVLDSVGGRVGNGLLTLEDARAVWTTPNLVQVGSLADEVRRRRHGDRATFVRVAEVAIDAWEAVEVPTTAGEIRLTGVPADVESAVAAVRGCVARANGTPVTAFSLSDLHRTTGGGARLSEWARRLADAGLVAISEAPVDQPDIRAAVAATLEAGLPVARFTLDSLEADPVDIVYGVRGLQKTTGVVSVFAPLPRRFDRTRPSTGYDDVKLVALARLVLDNVSSIQVDWSLYGPKLAQVALLFGADDLDAVSPHDDAPEGRRRAPLEEVRRNIRAASLSPVERDGRFGVRE
jgi:hypothetical protein